MFFSPSWGTNLLLFRDGEGVRKVGEGKETWLTHVLTWGMI